MWGGVRKGPRVWTRTHHLKSSHTRVRALPTRPSPLSWLTLTFMHLVESLYPWNVMWNTHAHILMMFSHELKLLLWHWLNWASGCAVSVTKWVNQSGWGFIFIWMCVVFSSDIQQVVFKQQMNTRDTLCPAITLITQVYSSSTKYSTLSLSLSRCKLCLNQDHYPPSCYLNGLQIGCQGFSFTD